MGIIIKSTSEIEKMRIGGKILANVLEETLSKAKPGMKTKDLDLIAENIIKQAGATASFKGYRRFPASLCICINEEVVHGVPKSDKIIEDGDLLTIDCGVCYQGLHTDAARSIQVGSQTPQIQEMITTAYETLKKAIEKAKPGNYTNDISKAIEDSVSSKGFQIIYELTGHGVGRKIHEDPCISNYVDPKDKNVQLRPGMTLAIEPIFSNGSSRLFTASDKWTLITQDLSTSIQVEDTVLITENGNEILTKLD